MRNVATQYEKANHSVSSMAQGPLGVAAEVEADQDLAVAHETADVPHPAGVDLDLAGILS